ncbi:hypothetical protein Tco_0630721 [Tanacetum coccineum]
MNDRSYDTGGMIVAEYLRVSGLKETWCSELGNLFMVIKKQTIQRSMETKQLKEQSDKSSADLSSDVSGYREIGLEKYFKTLHNGRERKGSVLLPGLTDSETESDEEVSPEINAGTQAEGQARPNPGIQHKGRARSNPGDATESQPQSSHVVHAGPNLEHMDFEVTNASTQQNLEQMDELFITKAYPSVQENLKLPTEDQVRLEEPASSAGTLSSLQNLDKELSFTNQFLVEKSQEDEPDKSNTEAEV